MDDVFKIGEQSLLLYAMPGIYKNVIWYLLNQRSNLAIQLLKIYGAVYL